MCLNKDDRSCCPRGLVFIINRHNDDIFTTALFKSAWYLQSSNILHTHDSNNKPLIETIIKKLPQQFAVIEAQFLILNMRISYSFLLSSFDWEGINYYVSELHKQADSKFVLSNRFLSKC